MTATPEKAPLSEKLCNCCGVLKPITEWYRNKRARDGLSSQCKKCNYAYWQRKANDPIARAKKLAHAKNWQNKNKEKYAQSRRWSGIKSKFGLTKQQYERILAEQNNKCAICATESPRGWDVFAVDHCHSSGAIRGLLCTNCNTALGLFKDSILSLNKAIEYLERQPTENTNERLLQHQAIQHGT